MHKLLAITILFFLNKNTFAQKNYWQQQVNINISVQLNDEKHTLKGFETIEYINNSPDTITYIWMHVWMNAYKNDQTAFTEQLLQQGNTKFYFSSEKDRGYINQLNFQSNNKNLKIDDHPNYIDIVKVYLAEPLLPKQKTIITTPFHIKLPANFSRGGHKDQSYQITQWYPKPAVYDAQGWHTMPYLDQGEFYSEFGNYEVAITLPSNYIVAATGELQNEDEKNWLQNQSTKGKEFSKQTIEDISLKNKSKIKEVPIIIKSSATFKTLIYKQDNVIDFAWFADKSFKILMDTVMLPSGKIVQCQSFYLPKNELYWTSSIATIKNTLKYRSAKIGEYPYNVCTAVDQPIGFDGGMEYPTITSIGGNYRITVDGTLEHEVGHNWFQAILANNERDYPWLDEGINTYYDNRFLYRWEDQPNYKKAEDPKKKKKLFSLNADNFSYIEILDILKKGQPINTSSQKFTATNYNLVAYEKTADWLKLVEQKIGRKNFDSTIKKYFNDWKFKHPTPQNFDAAFSNFSIYKDSLQQLRNVTTSLNVPTNIKKIGVLPVIGLNKYDGLQIGFGIHNYSLIRTKARYFVMPLYATKSNQLNGLGRIAYYLYPKKYFKRIDMGVAISKFSQNYFENEGAKVKLGFTKATPFIRFTFKNENLLSPIEKYIQLKHFNITEDNLNFIEVKNPGDTFYMPTKNKFNYYVNQLKFNIARTSALYPYKIQFQLEQINELLRTSITANQYFNYNEKQGIDVRFFAGKINYLVTKTTAKQYEYDRFALNLLSPKGNEDYTYSTYFYGRNAFEKLPSYQILNRDGNFKFRTDLLASKPGRTDNWLASINLVSDIPDRINPLQTLPFKLPIKLFADIGTYADVWKKNSGETKFLFDAGLQLTLLKGVVEVYLPLFYSKVFSDYSLQLNGKKRTTKNISFGINLNKLSIKNLIPQINF
jgi:hypothetical protein